MPGMFGGMGNSPMQQMEIVLSNPVGGYSSTTARKKKGKKKKRLWDALRGWE